MPIPALFDYDLENDSDFTDVKQIASDLIFRLRAKGYAEQVPNPIPAMDTPLHYWYAKKGKGVQAEYPLYDAKLPANRL